MYNEFVKDIFDGDSYSIVSIGGGNGADLCGVKDFLSKEQDHREVVYKLCDYAEFVEKFAQALGFSYHKVDLGDELPGGVIDQTTRAIILNHVLWAYLSSLEDISMAGRSEVLEKILLAGLWMSPFARHGQAGL
ncbi:hypothetical protein GPECTOR_132g598 [Gonium pectorale]|uniref:Uncharacterized protein n=1 Tax=Gonium pectorale TaxID=33097 RepID=A0A150FYA5_GONPE|nr:hypothetical protein GPECTOR_132g598 [Gonium pectorale]|eukprot:KXZ42586.1 hypothetical protein GPECTOR_132g598 [Gonium pectorale]